MTEINPNYWKRSIRWEFIAYPFFTSVYNLAAQKPSHPYYVTWNKYASFFEKGIAVSLLPTKYLDIVGRKIVSDTLNGNREYFNILSRVYKQINLATSICLKARDSSNTSDFVKIWPKIQKPYSEIATIYFHFDFALDKELKKLNATDPKLSALLQAYIFQGAPSFMSQAQTRLARLKKAYRNDSKKIYRVFYVEYGWFLNSYAGVFKITPSWLKNYMQEDFSIRTILKKNIPLSAIPKKYRLFAKLAKTAVAFRDDKKKFQLIVMGLMDKWLKAECKKRHWNFNTLRWLSMGEILSIIKNGNVRLLKKSNQYEKNQKRIGLLSPLGYNDISQNDWGKILKAWTSSTSLQAKGFPASPGIYIGKAKIINDPNVQKIKKGEVLITSMTRPEYLPLMNLAGAFVTDQGGITSHAAIVAREMKKPCVIGTKHATRIFKDGDTIKVDANNGTVIKL